MKIFLMTDNHLGHDWNNPITRYDSFIAFEESLKLAHDHNVDMILFGGDLFDKRHPPTEVMTKTIGYLRKYCYGPNQTLKIHDQHIHKTFLLPDKQLITNIQDPNIQIRIPAFIIYGNHDNDSGGIGTSPLSVLNNSGMINIISNINYMNYRQTLVLNPVILGKKGSSQSIALYGLPNHPDSYLYKVATEGEMIYSNIDELKQKAFPMMVVHQNRKPYAGEDYFPDESISKSIRFVLWGHEHESCPTPVRVNDFTDICQLGSTIATSMSSSECIPKHVAILEVHDNFEYTYTPLPLKLIRPMCLEKISLAPMGLKLSSDIEDMIIAKLREMIKTTQQKYDRLSTEYPALSIPKIRLKIQMDLDNINLNQGSIMKEFINLVANPKNVLSIEKQSSQLNNMEDDDIIYGSTRSAAELYNIVESTINALDLNFLSSRSMMPAVKMYLESHDQGQKINVENLFGEVIDKQMEKIKLDLFPSQTNPSEQLLTKDMIHSEIDKIIGKQKQHQLL